MLHAVGQPRIRDHSVKLFRLRRMCVSLNKLLVWTLYPNFFPFNMILSAVQPLGHNIFMFNVVTKGPSNYFNSIGNGVTFSLFKIVFQ